MPDRSLLMCQVTDPFGEVEAEGVTVEVLDGGFVVLGLDDGSQWLFNLQELRSAIEAAPQSDVGEAA
jgi:hypothetical protein